MAHHRVTRDRDIVRDGYVSGGSDGATDHAPLAHRRAAGNSRAAGNDRVLAHSRSVPNHYEVIELDSVLDDGVIDCTAIHRGVGAYFNVGADFDGTDLGNLHPFAILGGEAKTVGPDHDAGVHERARSDLDAATQRHARDQPNVLSHIDVVLYDTVRADHGARTYRNPLADEAERANMSRRIDLGSGRHHSRRMNAGQHHGSRIQQRRDARKDRIGVGAHQHRDRTRGGATRIQHNGGRSSLDELRAVARIG